MRFSLSFVAAVVMPLLVCSNFGNGVHAFAPSVSVSPLAPPSSTTTRRTAEAARGSAVCSSPFLLRRVAQSRLWMGWGPEPIWSPCQVMSNEFGTLNESCVVIKVKVSPETAESFTIPGQYCQLRLTGDEECKPIYLAMASAPPAFLPEQDDKSVFEFLIKKTDNNDWITSAGVDMTLDISQVLGQGFAMEEHFEGFKYDFPLQNVIMAAAGTGIAPIKSVVESNCLRLSKADLFGGRSARLYFGNKDLADTPYVDLFPKWEALGVQVVPVMSDPPPTYSGRTGYVQTAMEEDGIPIPRNSGALMCGMKSMTDAVRDLLVKAGVFEGRILTNY